MKRLLFITLISTCTVFIAGAQEKGSINVNAGIDIGLPLGNFGEGYGIGIGVSAKGLYGITEQGQATLTLGFMRFGMKDGSDVASGSTSLIPFLAGYRHRSGNLYGEGQIGLTAVRTTVKVNDVGFGIGGFSGTSSVTHFGYGVGGGYLMGNLDLGLRFQGVAASGGSLNLIAVRAAYNFQIK